MIKRLRNKIAGLQVYMPAGEMKRYIGTDLADKIGQIIEGSGYALIKKKGK